MSSRSVCRLQGLYVILLGIFAVYLLVLMILMPSVRADSRSPDLDSPPAIEHRVLRLEAWREEQVDPILERLKTIQEIQAWMFKTLGTVALTIIGKEALLYFRRRRPALLQEKSD